MAPSRLKIDTSVAANAGSSSTKLYARHNQSLSPLPSPSAGSRGTRLRSVSNASTSSTLSIVSPKSSSTNASTTSLHIPSAPYTRVPNLPSRSPSPSSPVFDETLRIGPEYVLAMHDYSPQPQNATCLSFRAGQVIHVLNRDTSGWWDGELEGKRGWFPSNYVNGELPSLTEEELPQKQTVNGGHAHSMSNASAVSWASSAPREYVQHRRRPSIPEALGQEIDSYCPPLMVPLLHGLSLLQTAVRANRPSHFPPSTACIISCVRSILSATDTLLRDAPILQQFPLLAQERRKLLSVLASLVAQAKQASEDNVDEGRRELEVESMLRQGGQVFAHVRRFLAVAVQCGVELPGQRHSTASSTEAEGKAWNDRDSACETSSISTHSGPLDDQTPTQRRQREREILATQGSALRAKSTGDLRNRTRISTDDDSDPGVPLLPNRSLLARSKQTQYLIRDRALSRHKPGHSSTSSSSSFSSQDSAPAASFPCGPTTAAHVIEALRFTHDQYLSTIAAFIGHAHSHSRSCHASSTGHLYDLVREIVEVVCKLLTIVEAVMNHPDVPTHRLGNLKSAKEGLYNVTSSLAESVRLLTFSLPSALSEEEEKQTLLRSATGALKAGADCVAAVKVCLNRSVGDRFFIINLPRTGDGGSQLFTPSKFSQPTLQKSISMSALNGYRSDRVEDDDLTIQAVSPASVRKSREASSGSDNSSSSVPSDDTNPTSPEEGTHIPPSLTVSRSPVEPDFPSPTSINRTDEDGTTWEGSSGGRGKSLEDKIVNGNLPATPLDPIPEFIQDPMAWMLSHDYSLDEVAYNSEGHLVGATMEVLVEKMTPHDSIVDPAFSAVFFLTFRLFSSPIELVDAIIARYNLVPPEGISNEDVQIWQQRKGIPVRLRVSNFIKMWVDMYWRSSVDDPALPALTTFTRDGLALLFPGPAQRILELINLRRQSNDPAISPMGDRSRDPGMSINPPTAVLQPSEVPRPTMTKILLVALRKKDFTSISVTDFDALELARQLTIMECNLYCAIQPEEILETGQECAKPPVNIRAVSSLSTVITGWVAESILNEPDIKKRTLLIKFFIKVADRCTSLHNYSTPRSMLAALDSSTISRLYQTWLGLPQKYKSQLESLRRLADHSRNYHEYRSKLRNTAPPAVPFLGLYLTDVTFCREGNPSHRTSPMNPSKKLLNFNKYHKLARIVQDMQRFQVPYNLKAIPEVQEYLNVALENSRHHGDLQDLYRRSLLVEPRQPADTPPAGDMRQLFNWATRSQSQPTSTLA